MYFFVNGEIQEGNVDMLPEVSVGVLVQRQPKRREHETILTIYMLFVRVIGLLGKRAHSKLSSCAVHVKRCKGQGLPLKSATNMCEAI